MTTKEQYDQIKAQHLDAIILFRVGDFYEVYYEDAEKASKTLSVTLTHRGDGTPLCGFPYHALDSYLPKLVRAGYRVAICDYQEEPKPDRFTKYGVTETINPNSCKNIEAAENKESIPKNLLTSDEAAEYLGISKSYLYKLTMQRKIPHYKPFGKFNYFDRNELEEWAKSVRVTTVNETKIHLSPDYQKYLFKLRDEIAKELLARNFERVRAENAAQNANRLVKLLYGIDLSEQVFK